MLKRKEIQESILSIMLWLLASLVIVYPVGLYLSPAILHYFHANFMQNSIDTLSMVLLISYIIGLLVSVLLIYFVQHRVLLKIGCVCIILGGLGMLIYYPNVFFPTIGSIGFGTGLIPAASVCSVSAKIHIMDLVWEDDIILSPRSKEQLAQKNTTEHMLIHPIGILMVMPILIGIVVFTRSLISIYIATIIFAVLLFILLHICKDFGAHHVQASFKRIIQHTVGNSIFWSVLLIITLTLLAEFTLLYHLPISFNTILLASQNTEREIIRALVFMILVIMRITVIIFTAISLNRVPPRRIILLCGITLGLGMLLFYPLQLDISPFILFALVLISAVIVPALLKSCSNFIGMGVLPIAIAIISILGNTTLFIAKKYNLLTLLPQKSNIIIGAFYTIFGIILLASSLVFFFVSYKKYNRMSGIRQ